MRENKMSKTPKTEKAAKRDPGQPTKYKPDFARQAALFCERGATDAEVADLLQIDRATLYRWKLKFPEFCDSLKVGKEPADDRVERSLFHNATGYDYYEEQVVKFKTSVGTEDFEIVKVLRHRAADTTAQIFWSENRRPDTWRERGANDGQAEFTPEQLARLVTPPELCADEPGPEDSGT